MVDDPYLFGAIAAANSLSDIYAMGATPIAMLSSAGFPRGKLPWEALGEILRGGADKAREAGVDVVGGHTVDDPEPKAGYAVIGTLHPDHIISDSIYVDFGFTPTFDCNYFQVYFGMEAN